MTTNDTITDGEIIASLEDLHIAATAHADIMPPDLLVRASAALDELANLLGSRMPLPLVQDWTIAADALARAVGAVDLPPGICTALRDATDGQRNAVLQVLLRAGVGGAEADGSVAREVTYCRGAARLTTDPQGRVTLDLGSGAVDLRPAEVAALQDLGALLAAPAVQLAVAHAMDLAEELKHRTGGRT